MAFLPRSIRRVAALATVLACLAPSAPARAACTQKEVGGAWQVNFAVHTGSAKFWMNCSLYLKPTGAFTTERSSCAAFSGYQREVFGMLRLARGQACGYEGYLYLGSLRINLPHATMNRSKDHLDGVGTLTDGTAMFAATRL